METLPTTIDPKSGLAGISGDQKDLSMITTNINRSKINKMEPGDRFVFTKEMIWEETAEHIKADLEEYVGKTIVFLGRQDEVLYFDGVYTDHAVELYPDVISQTKEVIEISHEELTTEQSIDSLFINSEPCDNFSHIEIEPLRYEDGKKDSVVIDHENPEFYGIYLRRKNEDNTSSVFGSKKDGTALHIGDEKYYHCAKSIASEISKKNKLSIENHAIASLEVLSKKYAERFMEWQIQDTQAIYDYIDELIERGYFWEKDISVAWNKEENNSFDVFYNTKIGNQEYYISVEYVEWLNETEDAEKISKELVEIIERINGHIKNIDAQNELWDIAGVVSKLNKWYDVAYDEIIERITENENWKFEGFSSPEDALEEIDAQNGREALLCEEAFLAGFKSAIQYVSSPGIGAEGNETRLILPNLRDRIEQFIDTLPNDPGNDENFDKFGTINILPGYEFWACHDDNYYTINWPEGVEQWNGTYDEMVEEVSRILKEKL